LQAQEFALRSAQFNLGSSKSPQVVGAAKKDGNEVSVNDVERRATSKAVQGVEARRLRHARGLPW
jgi:hypothetical protein